MPRRAATAWERTFVQIGQGEHLADPRRGRCCEERAGCLGGKPLPLVLGVQVPADLDQAGRAVGVGQGHEQNGAGWRW
jgi:hypothetical protein